MKYMILAFLACFQFTAFAETLALSNRPLYDILNQVKTEHLQLYLIAQQSGTHMQEIHPAEIKIVNETDIFLIIKPFDNAIEKIAHNQKKEILIANDLSPHILPLRNHNHPHDIEHKDYHNQDPHLWLSPWVVRDIIGELKKQNPLWIDNQKYDEFIQYISNLQKQQPTKNNQPYWLVYHDAWQYLEDFFGLNRPVIFTQNPESILKPKDFKKAVEINKKQSFNCIIIEPTTNKRSIRKVTEIFDGKIILLDPTGKTAPKEENSLYWIWSNYSKAIQSCRK